MGGEGLRSRAAGQLSIASRGGKHVHETNFQEGEELFGEGIPCVCREFA